VKYFIGAKNLDGQVIVAEIIEADDFHDAVYKAQGRAFRCTGGAENYRLTAVNEQIDMEAARKNVRGHVAKFLEGAPA